MVMDLEKLLIPDLTDSVAIVTGAGRGIGRTIAEALALCGSRVVLAARSEGDLDAVKAEIESRGGTALAIPTDVSQSDAVRTLFRRVDEAYDRQLDFLINNAGTGVYGDIVDFSLENLERLIAVNVNGVYQGCQEAMRRMIPQKRGAIINISSVVGLKGYAQQSAYTATKHAVVGITKTLALEAQPHNIRVAVVCPGGVDTDLVGVARPDLDRSVLLKTEDIARCVLFQLSLPLHAAVDSISIRRFNSSPW